MRKCMPIIKFAAVCALCVLMVGFRFYIADAEQNQQTSAVQITDSGGSRVSEDGRVKVSKTIAASELENVFDITLKVETKNDIYEFCREPNMAVVIVMDISNTMNESFGGTTRYEAAMQAAEAFFDNFAAQSSDVSKIGYVAFNTDAHQILNMQNCGEKNVNDLKNEIRRKSEEIIHRNGYAGSKERFTNIEAGLKMAEHMLGAEGNANENQYIIFLSDGFPTTYTRSGYQGYQPYCSGGSAGQDGVFYDAVTGKYCNYGTSYSDKAAAKAGNAAAAIKNQGIKIFSIGIDIGGQTIQRFIDQTAGKNFSVVDRMSENYEIGSASEPTSYQSWLKNRIGSGIYYDSSNPSELEKAYAEIFQKIQEERQQKAKAIWMVNDPMPTRGSDAFVEFIGFYDKSQELVSNSLNGMYEPHAENTADFETASKAIHWDLKSSGYQKTEEAGQTLYQYELTYRVRLRNENAAFLEETSYPTNNPTKMTYQIIEKVNQQTVVSEKRKIEFPIPSVKGYDVALRFVKTDERNRPVAEAEFTLEHDEARCCRCRGDERSVFLLPMQAVSDENGAFCFEKIPSGHRYTLTETKIPSGYTKNNEQYRVTAAYDKVSVFVSHSDNSETELDAAHPIQIINRAGYELPETGAGGNTIFTAVGCFLILMALLREYNLKKNEKGRMR